MAWVEVSPLSKKNSLSVMNKFSKDDKIHIKEGVWNPYREVSIGEAKEIVGNSELGGRICRDEESGEYFISCPYYEDMW